MIEITNKSKFIALLADINNQPVPKVDCDILALKFDENIENSTTQLKKMLPEINTPLMICGCGKEETDAILLPELINLLDRQCIISYITEKTYKKILPPVIKGGHYAVLKTPIDISLAKELNILSINLGLGKDKIIMNTDIGALGYGYEYGYSMIEKTRLENDEYLNFPILSEAPLESLKTKEAKESVNKAKMIEITSAAGVIAAGANIVVTANSEIINTLRKIIL